MKMSNSKHIITIIVLSILFTCVCPSWAQSSRVITLNDGSVIKGEVQSLQNGIYTIKTANLGTINIKESEVAGISNQGIQPKGSLSTQEEFNSMNKAQLQTQVQQMQGQVLQDPYIMQDIEKLTEDEEIRMLLSDPNLMNDILSYDPARIQHNPKFQKLMQNPQMRELINKISGSLSTQQQK